MRLRRSRYDTHGGPDWAMITPDPPRHRARVYKLGDHWAVYFDAAGRTVAASGRIPTHQQALRFALEWTGQ